MAVSAEAIALCREMRARFIRPTYPGEACHQSGHVYDRTLAEWDERIAALELVEAAPPHDCGPAVVAALEGVGRDMEAWIRANHVHRDPNWTADVAPLGFELWRLIAAAREGGK